jgi:hypothetical protein
MGVNHKVFSHKYGKFADLKKLIDLSRTNGRKLITGTDE